VRWEAIPYGEAVKVGVALALAIMGYLMYRAKRRNVDAHTFRSA